MFDVRAKMQSLFESAAPLTPLLRVERLSKRYPVTGKRGAWLHAVDDVSLHIAPGESLGLVGESGCGKSTLVRLLARLIDSSEGRIVFDGEDLAITPAKRFARMPQRAAIQMVFQDPTDSLNPRYTARDTIAEPCRLLAQMNAAAAHARVDEVAAQVGLPLELLSRFPHQLSGFGAQPQAADTGRTHRRAGRFRSSRGAAVAGPFAPRIEPGHAVCQP
jgi:peptide/nickel transport system ATP-binding protein